MATLKEYYQTDFANSLTFGFQWGIQNSTDTIDVKVGFEMYSWTSFIAYYVPRSARYLGLFLQLIDSYPRALEKAASAVDASGSFPGETTVGRTEITHSQSSTFSHQVYIYTEDVLTRSDYTVLDAHCKSKSICLTVRGADYMNEKQALERPLAFICHDSRDKVDVAYPIAVGLQKLMCPVWYDEFSLKVGDSLRESLEKGLKEAHKCIVILSPNFIANNGWTKREFNSVFTREIIEEQSIVLPVWYNVSRREVYDYSPSLADKKAANWDLGKDEVVRQLYLAVKARPT